MPGIFPYSADGGLPPNAALPLNPSHAYAPQFVPVKPPNAALYYGNGCDVRLRPEVVNSLISELEAVSDRAEVAYDSARLTNTELAMRYLIQRGLPRGGITSGSSLLYTLTLDPVATRVNDYMTLTVVPHVTNTGVVRLTLGALGYMVVLRNDGQELVAGDWQALKPTIIAHYGGNWYNVGLVKSQLPASMLPQSDIDGWIRTDGNDANDGTANTPAKAFRTIQGAWNKISSTYVASPVFAVNLRLGIPGDYEAGSFANFGGSIRLFGDQANRNLYRILQSAVRPDTNFCFSISNVASNLYIRGVTFVLNRPAPSIAIGLQLNANSNTQVHDCDFDVAVSNAGGVFIVMGSGATMGHMGVLNFYGHGTTMRSCHFVGNAVFGTQAMEVPVNLNHYDITCTDSFFNLTWLSTCWMPATTLANVNTHGKKYSIETGSIMQGSIFGASLPGDVAGTTATGGQFI